MTFFQGFFRFQAATCQASSLPTGPLGSLQPRVIQVSCTRFLLVSFGPPKTYMFRGFLWQITWFLGCRNLYFLVDFGVVQPGKFTFFELQNMEVRWFRSPFPTFNWMIFSFKMLQESAIKHSWLEENGPLFFEDVFTLW